MARMRSAAACDQAARNSFGPDIILTGAAKKSQDFVQEPVEEDQPVWRVVQLNRK